MIHKECGTRVRQQYICPTDDVVVPREDIVKGYEFAKGQYVLFDDEELKVVEAPKSDSIDIVGFVPAGTGRTGCTSTRPTTSGRTRAAPGRTGCSRRRSGRRGGWPSPSTPPGARSTWS